MFLRQGTPSDRERPMQYKRLPAHTSSKGMDSGRRSLADSTSASFTSTCTRPLLISAHWCASSFNYRWQRSAMDTRQWDFQPCH